MIGTWGTTCNRTTAVFALLLKMHACFSETLAFSSQMTYHR